MADDLGYGDIGVYGQSHIDTPHLDRMASEGLRFTDAYSGSTVCRPARNTLMTGQHTGHTLIRGNNRQGEINLRPEDRTIAEVLRCAGYQTAVFGKWALGQEGTTGEPNRQGFDNWMGYLDQTHAHDYYPTFLFRDGESFQIPENQDGAQGRYSHDLIIEAAEAFLRESHERPFLLYLPFTLPHANNELGRETGNGMQVPSDEPYSHEPWPQVERNFAAAVTLMDASVGRLLATLDAEGLSASTLVLFTSDNGPHSEGGHDALFFGSSGGLRGAKRELYEGGIRVPSLVRWPGVVAEGRVSDTSWAFYDVMPTLAELAGLSRPPGVDGISIAREILGGPQGRRDSMYWEYRLTERFTQAVRIEQFKGVRHTVLDTSAPRARFVPLPIEIYDLEQDPGETRDVSAAFPRLAGDLESVMERSHLDSNEWNEFG